MHGQLYRQNYMTDVLRFADGYTLRANSINPIYSSTLSLHEKLNFCEKEYEQRNLPIVYKLTSDSQLKDIDIELEKRGYPKTKEVSLKVLQMDNYYQGRQKSLWLH